MKSRGLSSWIILLYSPLLITGSWMRSGAPGLQRSFWCGTLMFQSEAQVTVPQRWTWYHKFLITWSKNFFLWPPFFPNLYPTIWGKSSFLYSHFHPAHVLLNYHLNYSPKLFTMGSVTNRQTALLQPRACYNRSKISVLTRPLCQPEKLLGSQLISILDSFYSPHVRGYYYIKSFTYCFHATSELKTFILHNWLPNQTIPNTFYSAFKSPNAFT